MPTKAALGWLGAWTIPTTRRAEIPENGTIRT